MKVIPDTNKATKEGLYVWNLARNLLRARRNLRRIRNKYNQLNFKKQKECDFVLGELTGIENEAHNRYYAAIEYFKI